MVDFDVKSKFQLQNLFNNHSLNQPNQLITSRPRLFNNLLTLKQTFFYLCGGVSLLRPAPLELPQGGNAARVES